MSVIHTTLFKREEQIIQKMKEAGYPVSETIRQIIREFGKETFPEKPAYVVLAAEKLEIRKAAIQERERVSKMTKEEFAVEVLKGKIDADGKRVEFRDEYGNSIYRDLFNIKTLDLDNDYEIFRHINFVNRCHVFVNGQSPSEADYERIFKDW